MSLLPGSCHRPTRVGAAGGAESGCDFLAGAVTRFAVLERMSGGAGGRKGGRGGGGVDEEKPKNFMRVDVNRRRHDARARGSNARRK
jgi:hypothetical protein